MEGGGKKGAIECVKKGAMIDPQGQGGDDIMTPIQIQIQIQIQFNLNSSSIQVQFKFDSNPIKFKFISP